MDESGILGGESQRFFALGLLKLEDTAALGEAGHRVLDRAKSGTGLQDFEFKFNEVTNSGLPYHLELIDAYFSLPDSYFCAFIIDKSRPGVDWKGYYPTVWDAYLGYSTVFVRNMCGRARRSASLPTTWANRRSRRGTMNGNIAARIRDHVGCATLAANFTVTASKYFSVWEFIPS